VAQEVGHVELLPELLVGVGRQAVQAQVLMASCWRFFSSRSAEGASPPSTRRVMRYRSSSSLPFQAFQTFGLVPRMSATVSRYSAVRWRSSLTSWRRR
jgi:hypothetical protein